MKSFAAACIATLALADPLIQSGINANQGDAALSYVFANMPQGVVESKVFGEGQDAAANNAAVNLNDWFMANANNGAGLPEVCPKGQECRKEVRDRTVITVTEQWKTMYAEIDEIFSKSFTRAQGILENAYGEAKKCAPGCMCDQITVEYADIIRQQVELEQTIKQLTFTEQELHTAQSGYLVSCPEYEYIHLNDDQTVAVYDVKSWNEEVLLDEKVTESANVIDQSQETKAEQVVMTSNDQAGNFASDTETAIVGSNEGDWETLSTESGEAVTTLTDEGDVVQAGYQ